MLTLYTLFCMIVLLLGALLDLFLIAANVLILVHVIPGTSTIAEGMGIVLRIFTIILALVSVVAKKENQFLFRYLFLLEDWKGVGMLDIFIAVLTLSSIPQGAEQWLTITCQVAGWALIGIGVVFFLLGLLGGKHIYKETQSKPEPPK